MTTREAAKSLGVGATSIRKYRKLYDSEADGDILVEGEAQTVAEANALLQAKGIDPDNYNVSYGFSEWQQGDRTLKSVRVKASPKSAKSAVAMPDIQELFDLVDNYETKPQGKRKPGKPTRSTLVVCPSDWQIGKTDKDGGHEGTIKRVVNSLNNLLARIGDDHYEEIILGELGDIVENFYNTSSQRETNDLDITSQIRVARRLLLRVIRELKQHADRLVYVAVPSNHGTVRVGFQQEASTIDNDWGLAIQDQIADVIEHGGKEWANVELVRPERLEDSVLIRTASGVPIGFAHGHQASNPDKIGEWWKGQSHGRGPVAEADILVVGHWHSLRVQQSGNGRWIMVAPTSDPGSSWYTRRTGESSQTGMLVFALEDGTWKDLEIC